MEKSANFEWTAPKLTRNSKSEGSYILRFTVNKKAYRIRSGDCIGRPDIKPNQHRGPLAKKQWSLLTMEIVKLLERGINPMDSRQRQLSKTGYSLGELFKKVMKMKMQAKFSEMYKRDMINRGNHFLMYLKKKDMYDMSPNDFHGGHVSIYMDQFSEKSETYFNNMRRTISAVFQLGVEREIFKSNPFLSVKLKKEEEKKNVPFSSAQIVDLMKFMEEQKFYKLMIVGHLEYFCLLRPHREIRMLTRGDFSEDLSQIILSGSRTKNKKRRVVTVHPNTIELLDRINVRDMSPSTNIFSGKEEAYTYSYFNNRWARFKKRDTDLGNNPKHKHETILLEDQTLYSFRHSGAIAFYKEHQDIEALRQSFNHSNISVTEGYLRGMGGLSSQNKSGVPDWNSLV